MNNRQVTEEDLQTIRSQQDSSPIVRFLRTKDSNNFGVGDFLIKCHRRGDKWEPETISGVSDQPKRFVCIYEDEYGIKYVKPLTSLGKELPYITQLTDSNDYTRYEVDPEYAEHIILDGENNFDFSEKRKQEKAQREAISKKNRKLAIRIYNLDHMDTFLKKLSKGSKLWVGHNIPACASSTPHIFSHHTVEKLNTWQYDNNPSRTSTVKAFFTNQLNAHTVYFTSEDLVIRTMMTTEPFKYETI